MKRIERLLIAVIVLFALTHVNATRGHISKELRVGVATGDYYEVQMGADPREPAAGEPFVLMFSFLNKTDHSDLRHINANITITLDGKSVLERKLHLHEGHFELVTRFNNAGSHKVAVRFGLNEHEWVPMLVAGIRASDKVGMERGERMTEEMVREKMKSFFTARTEEFVLPVKPAPTVYDPILVGGLAGLVGLVAGFFIGKKRK